MDYIVRLFTDPNGYQTALVLFPLILVLGFILLTFYFRVALPLFIKAAQKQAKAKSK